MRILLVANGYPPLAVGGVEVYTAGLAQALQARGNAVSVMCAQGAPDQPDYELLEEHAGDIALFRLVNNYRKIHSFAETFANPQIEQAFGALLDRLQPDLVHFNHLIALSARLPLITAARGIPSVFTAHDFWTLCQRIYLHNGLRQACPGPANGGDCYTCITSPTPARHVRTVAVSTLRNVIPFRLRAWLREVFTKDDYFLPDMQATRRVLDQRYALFRRALEGTGRILVPSHFVKRMLQDNGYRGDHIEVLPLGLEKPAAPPTSTAPARPLRLAFVGSIMAWKGTEVLVRAFKVAKHPDLRLTFYGREDIIPAFSHSLRQLASGDERIVFAGPFQPGDRDRIYSEIDILVVASIEHESFSLVAREALLRGKPVIATRLGALPELVEHGVNGFLVPPGDVEALAALFIQLADHPEMLTALQLPGPATILSVDQHIDRLVAIYESCLSSRS